MVVLAIRYTDPEAGEPAEMNYIVNLYDDTDATLIIAAYKDGRMTSDWILPPENGSLSIETGYMYKMFIVDANYVPICEALTIVGSDPGNKV